MLLLYYYRFAGGGALRYLAAAQCSTSRLHPHNGGRGDAPVVGRYQYFSRCSSPHPVPLMDAVFVPQYRGHSSWRSACDTAIRRATKRPRWQPSWHNPPRPTMWTVESAESPSATVLYFRSHSIPTIFLRVRAPGTSVTSSARSYRNGATNCVLIQVFDCVKSGQQ